MLRRPRQPKPLPCILQFFGTCIDFPLYPSFMKDYYMITPHPKNKIKRKKRDHCITAELKYHCNWFHVILNPWMSPLSRTQYTNTKGGTARQKGSPRVTSSYMWLGILIHKNNLVTIISIACLCDSHKASF